MACLLLYPGSDGTRDREEEAIQTGLPVRPSVNGSGTMEWNWDWLFARSRNHAGEGERDLERRRMEDWEAQLVEEGMSKEWAARVARRLEPLYQELGRGSAEALIRAATVTAEVRSETHANVEHGTRDVKEVERLLGAFSGELEKLDEVLEVLAAYAQRMKSKPTRKPGHTLH